MPGALSRPEQQSRLGWLFPGAVALALLGLGAAVTAAFAISMDRAARALTQSTLEERASHSEHAVEDRMMACEAVLRAGAGFIDNAWPIAEEQWRRFVRPLNLGEVMAGVQGFGFTAVVDKLSPTQIGALPSRVWSNPAGREDHPQTAIVFLEPQDVRNRQALGFDMASEAVRRVAMERARDESTAAVTGKVTLVQEIDSAPQPGFLMYVPVYQGDLPTATVEQRREALIGYVYSPFRAGDFMERVFEGDPRDVELEVYDDQQVHAGALLYRRAADDASIAESVFVLRQIVVGGHGWTLRLTATASMIKNNQVVPVWIVWIAGACGSVLLSALAFAMARSRHVLRERVLADERLLEQERDAATLLERRVGERTLELETANRRLEAAYRDLEAFTRSVSHDLRAPLRAIQGYSSMLVQDLGKAVTPQVQRDMDAIGATTQRMDAIIDNLLKLASVSQRELQTQELELGDLLRQVVSEVNPQSPAEVHIALRPSECVRADAGLLTLALRNLISNAVKFSQTRANPEIWVGATRVAGGDRAYFIRDNGVGFDPKYSPRLFGAFQRLHSEREFEGTGLGLTIVKSVIEKHGGRVWAESQPGAGATFYFILPECTPVAA